MLHETEHRQKVELKRSIPDFEFFQSTLQPNRLYDGALPTTSIEIKFVRVELVSRICHSLNEKILNLPSKHPPRNSVGKTKSAS